MKTSCICMQARIWCCRTHTHREKFYQGQELPLSLNTRIASIHFIRFLGILPQFFSLQLRQEYTYVKLRELEQKKAWLRPARNRGFFAAAATAMLIDLNSAG